MSAPARFDLVADIQDLTDPSPTPARPPIPPTILDHLSPPYFNFEQHLQDFPILPTPPGLERIKCYVHNTSISPFGYGYPPQCSEVLCGRLWISEDLGGTDSSNLRYFGITHVISFGQEELTGCTCLEENSTIYSRLEAPNDVRGDRPLVGIIDDAVAFIDEALRTSSSHRVLVYCGVDWSQRIATACLMNETGCSFDEAQEVVLLQRGTFLPNPAIDEAVHQWWSLSQLRVDFPEGRGYKKFKWRTTAKETQSGKSLENYGSQQNRSGQYMFP